MSAGASLIAAPFLRGLQGAAAQAAPRRAKRLLLFFTPDGTIPHLWRPEGGEFDFRFSENGFLTPLTEYRDDLLLLDGVNFLTGNNHEGGMSAMLTNGNGPESISGGMSIDQFIAARIGQESRFPSLELGVLTDPWGASIQTRMSYRSAGDFVHPDADPRSVYRRLFGGVSQDAAALEQLALRRRSVLDLVLGELNDLRRRIGTIEQHKLDRHLDAIRQVERTLFPDDERSCESPNPPGRLNKDDYAAGAQLLRAQSDLALTALACDLSPVVTIQMSHTVSPAVFSWAGNREGHHALSHAADGDVDLIDQLRASERWCAEQFAYLIDGLKAIPQADGDGSLFDDTLLLWVKELGDSRLHICESVPFIFAGRAGGFIRPGRYLRYPGVSHSQLLVSLCHAFGIDVESFGDPRTGLGGLSGLS